jgi:hypothetical protein
MIDVGGFLDGGTISFNTTENFYCLDGRIGSKTKNKLFYGYQKDDKSNIVENQYDTFIYLIETIINEYNDKFKDILLNKLNESKQYETLIS